jgi:hypothetical protein
MEEGALDAPGHRYSERRREMGLLSATRSIPGGLLASQVGKAPSSDVPRPLAKLAVMSFLRPGWCCYGHSWSGEICAAPGPSISITEVGRIVFRAHARCGCFWGPPRTFSKRRTS